MQTDVQHLVLGDVTLTRVVEYTGELAMTPQEFFPQQPRNSWEHNGSWLAPDFWDRATNHCVTTLQTWVLRSAGAVILVDTGAGNHKDRPDAPIWDRLDTPFLDTLAAAGIRPADVDIVVNTHLHADHVGWNTVPDGDDWVPTFPRATYLVPQREFDRWNPDGGQYTGGNRNVFEDSITPVHRAGQLRTWDHSHRIDRNLRLDLCAGHTPGSAAVTLESGTDRAVFVGDLLHSPFQFVQPDVNSCFCENPAAARESRRRVLGWAAETNALVFPAHVGGHGGAEVARAGDRFAIKNWAPFPALTP